MKISAIFCPADSCVLITTFPSPLHVNILLETTGGQLNTLPLLNTLLDTTVSLLHILPLLHLPISHALNHISLIFQKFEPKLGSCKETSIGASSSFRLNAFCAAFWRNCWFSQRFA
eukprot:GFUD01139779.1.p1 GENE.GFUD01139779.1~~GFUD01139779.1.p1  ORF type:complete len:116 (-),score=8.00 GFUD01139779.1:361-708(-)